MTSAGYGNGALKALDFFADGDAKDKWTFDEEGHTWKEKIESIMTRPRPD